MPDSNDEHIIDKLKVELSKDAFNKYELIYFLVLIRKILEEGGEARKKEFKFVYFYCNWALHSKINRTEDMSEVLNGILQNYQERIHQMFSLAPFEEDLKKFLDSFRLDTGILTTPSRNAQLRLQMLYALELTPLYFRENQVRIVLHNIQPIPNTVGSYSSILTVQDVPTNNV
jgi:hypothetical protein